MYVIAVEFRIREANMNDFRDVIKTQAENSLTLEPECHQFDVCYSDEDPHVVFLYEKYTDKAAFDFHTSTPHFAQFMDKAGDWIESRDLKVWTCG